MIELRRVDESLMNQSFAGDVFNSAVYLKRCFENVSCAMVTAIGNDSLSSAMLETFVQASLDTEMVFRHPQRNAGLYAIETDSTGERSFTYWRSEAAARTIVDFLNPQVITKFEKGDLLFFSGISLAVIEPESRPLFWQKLKDIKDAGVKVVFDPNYRARMWSSTDDAKREFEQAFTFADIALPGVEDLTSLYGISNAEGVIEFCKSFDINEVIVKDGPSSVNTLVDSVHLQHNIIPNKHVVDTTSAGDAFNGVYLGARMSKLSVEGSVELAAKAASIVIQHPGAIAPEEAFTNAMSGLINTHLPSKH